MVNFFLLKNICLMREEELGLSSSILPSVIEQEAESDNKQENTLIFDSSVALSMFYVCNFKNTSGNLQYCGSKPALTSLCSNASAIKKSEKSCLTIQCLSLPSQLFTAFLSVPLPIIFSSFMYANTVHMALARHVGTNTQQGLCWIFPCISYTCGDLEHNRSQSCQHRPS